MGSHISRIIKVGVIAAALGSLASCGPKSTPPPPPPPPSPPVVVIPPRPLPPLGASALLAVPLVGADGVRQTINAHISPIQTQWNLRSAFNVAALNCLRPEHAEILTAYKAYLKTQRIALAKVNKNVDGEFRQKYGTAFVHPREVYMTQVYNYYAFPPVLPRFCDAALVMAREVSGLKSADLPAFSARNLVQLDAVYEKFFKSYEQYRADAAAWDAKYAPVVAPVAPATPVATSGSTVVR
ncbi:MAG: hypothetical protein JSR28_18675 [Proteobacteria bacterium]|nr:hypothetical protein [Pseudomonadota bacterium]